MRRILIVTAIAVAAPLGLPAIASAGSGQHAAITITSNAGFTAPGSAAGCACVTSGSGTAATLEMCRALGSAVKRGWKPRRTLVYASWDGEEYGLVGSTEWADDHAREIDEKAVLMLNVDSAVAGRVV